MRKKKDDKRDRYRGEGRGICYFSSWGQINPIGHDWKRKEKQGRITPPGE